MFLMPTSFTPVFPVTQTGIKIKIKSWFWGINNWQTGFILYGMILLQLQSYTVIKSKTRTWTAAASNLQKNKETIQSNFYTFFICVLFKGFAKQIFLRAAHVQSNTSIAWLDALRLHRIITGANITLNRSQHCNNRNVIMLASIKKWQTRFLLAFCRYLYWTNYLFVCVCDADVHVVTCPLKKYAYVVVAVSHKQHCGTLQ